MNRSLFNECTGLFVVILFNFNVCANDQINPNDRPVEFASDFEGFLKDLGSILNKSKSHQTSESVSWKKGNNDLSRRTTPRTRGSGKGFNSQKAALNDVLMMKLVSYYEDKYRLAHHESPTVQSITLSEHFHHAKPKKYNIVGVVDPAVQDDEKTKSVATRSNLDQVLEYMDNTHSSSAANVNTNQGVGNRPEQVEEVFNVMEYIPPTAGRVQNIIDYTIPNIGGQKNLDTRFPTAEKIQNTAGYTNPNIVRSYNNFNNKSPPEERIYNIADYVSPNVDVVNYEVTNIGKVKIPDYGLPHLANVQNNHGDTSSNFERPRNIQENIQSTRQNIPNFHENQYSNHHRVSNIVDYTLPKMQKVRNTIGDRQIPSERIRSTVGGRPQNIGRERNIPDNVSPEVGRVRHTFDNTFPEVERERVIFTDKSSNVEKIHNMDSTHPNVERMRIIIGTSPIDKTTMNMRKNNNDDPISEVIVI